MACTRGYVTAPKWAMHIYYDGWHRAYNPGQMGYDNCFCTMHQDIERRGQTSVRGGGRLNIPRYYEGLCGKALFMAVYMADCDRIVIENPTPSKVYDYPEPTQAIQPWQHGHPFTKKTLLWIKGPVPKLKPTNIVKPERTWCPSGSYSGKHNDKHRGMFTTDRAKNRSKTFPGIAKAMAEQWG